MKRSTELTTDPFCMYVGLYVKRTGLYIAGQINTPFLLLSAYLMMSIPLHPSNPNAIPTSYPTNTHILY